jgi:hypothetical protein
VSAKNNLSSSVSTDVLKHQINAGEIAAQKDAKVNTVQKRFTTLKQRYNLNIQTTAVGSTASATPTKPRAAKVTKKPSPKKNAGEKTNSALAAAIAEQLEVSFQMLAVSWC